MTAAAPAIVPRTAVVLLAGFETSPAERLAGELAPHGATTIAAPAAEEAHARLARGDVDVVCLGPAIPGAEALRFLRRAAAEVPGRRCTLVLAGGPDPSRFQDQIDGDQLFFLTREPPAPPDLRDLLLAALARVREERAAELPPAGRAGREVAARETVLELCRQLARAGDPAWAAGLVGRAARSLVGADRARCVLYDPRSQTFAADGGAPGPDGESSAAGLVGYAIRTGRTVRLERVGGDPRWDPEADTPEGSADDRFLATPLIVDGPGPPGPARRVWAVILLTRGPEEPPFTAADADTLGFLARHAAPLAGLLTLREDLDLLAAADGEEPAGGPDAGGESAGALFRRQAVEYHSGGARDGRGRPLEISPAWTRPVFALVVAAVAAALGLSVVARVGEYASGPAVVRAAGRTDVTSHVAGTVSEIAVAVGERVEEGQLLLGFHRADEAAELARIEGELEMALAQRLRDPADRGTEARLQALRTSRDLAASRLAARSVRAPHAGVVDELRARPGQLVAPGEVLLSLAGERGELTVLVMFPARHRPLLRPGMPVRLELDGYRHAYQDLRIERVAGQAVGPAEARRILGPEIGDAVTLASPVVFASARLPASGVFEGGGRRLRYHEGLQGTAEVRLRSQRVLTALVPGLDGLGGGGGG